MKQSLHGDEDLVACDCLSQAMESSLLLALAICLLINFLCPGRRAGVKNVRKSRTKISITFYNVERNIDQELRVDLTPLYVFM